MVMNVGRKKRGREGGEREREGGKDRDSERKREREREKAGQTVSIQRKKGHQLMNIHYYSQL